MDALHRFWSDLLGRWTGPMTFRFLLQPTMAGIYAIRDGLKDARTGQPAYFWAIFTDGGARSALLREGSRAVLRIIVLGVVMDVIYQLIEFRWVHPLQLVIFVLFLAFIPYLLLRGPVNRIARLWIQPRKVPTP